MKPVAFDHVNAVYGADQKEYKPLPAHESNAGIVTTCWEPSEEELKTIVETKRIYISLCTFGQKLQPIFACADIHEAICLQGCESCGKEFDIESMHPDSGSNWFCEECFNELAPVMLQEYQELKSKGEID